jgi:hypothetical protein
VSRVLERGDVFFFYRPRVGVERVDGLEDVQRFFFVLAPDGSERHRRLIVGRKRLPDPGAHERVWAFVVEVGGAPDDLLDDIERKAYETRTRGLRVQPEARSAGEGRYLIADHDGRHTHLVHMLELPREPGEAQRLFNIRREASFVVAVRNPDAPAPPGSGLPPRRRPELPPELLERFRDRRFAPLEPPAFLDHTGTEIVLIGAAEDAEAELGIAFDAEEERLDTADLFTKLRLPREDLPIEPLTEGELR